MKFVLILMFALLNATTVLEADHLAAHKVAGGHHDHAPSGAAGCGDEGCGQIEIVADCNGMTAHCLAGMLNQTAAVAFPTDLGAFQWRIAEKNRADGRSLGFDPPPPRA